MGNECHLAASSSDTPKRWIAELIRESYAGLEGILPSPYVDGSQVYQALVSLGHDMVLYGPELVTEALGPKGMRLPVANIDGKAKHYLPHAVPVRKAEAEHLSDQVADFVKSLRKFQGPN